MSVRKVGPLGEVSAEAGAGIRGCARRLDPWR
jgi:hypothetical protein